MDTVLSWLYDGKLDLSERIVSKKPEYRRLHRKVSDELDNWKRKLTPDEFERIEDMLSLHSDAESMQHEECFTYGFKLGALLMVEVFTGKDGLARGD